MKNYNNELESRIETVVNINNKIIRLDASTGNFLSYVSEDKKYPIRPDFATKFKTTSAYSNRAILGWYDTVYSGATEEFWTKFFAYAGTTSLRQLALDTAGKCVGKTPIRFYGDASWYGWAW